MNWCPHESVSMNYELLSTNNDLLELKLFHSMCRAVTYLFGTGFRVIWNGEITDTLGKLGKISQISIEEQNWYFLANLLQSGKNLCSLSLRSINFWTAFKKLVWGSKVKYNLGIFRSHIVKIHQFWHSKWGHFTAKFWGECRSWCVMHQGVEVKFCYALCIIETLLNDHIWWISPMW